jgi:hypothetical protein
MSRVPSAESREMEARRFLKAFDEQLARRPPYAWTTREDEIDEAAIMVEIGGTSAEMIGAGLSQVEPTASVYWSAQATPRGFFQAGSEMGPWTVPAALQWAHERCELCAYDRVVILIEERGMWRDEWGTLAVREGL